MDKTASFTRAFETRTFRITSRPCDLGMLRSKDGDIGLQTVDHFDGGHAIGALPDHQVFALGLANGSNAFPNDRVIAGKDYGNGGESSACAPGCLGEPGEKPARPIDEEESKTAEALSAIEQRVENHESRLADAPTIRDLVTVVDELIDGRMKSIDAPNMHLHSIQLVRTAVSQTDQLIARVLDALESLNARECEHDAVAGVRYLGRGRTQVGDAYAHGP